MTFGQWTRVVVLALIIFGLDQLTKGAVVANMTPGQSIPHEGFLRFTYVHNTGMAFGLFRDQGLLLTIASFIGVAVLLLYFRRNPLPGVLPLVSLGLLLGGAIGNLADRVRLGYVVDFIDVGPWPIFNLADTFIVTGVVLLLLILYQPREPQPAGDAGEQGVGAWEEGRGEERAP